jgi:hypothetical protein
MLARPWRRIIRRARARGGWIGRASAVVVVRIVARDGPRTDVDFFDYAAVAVVVVFLWGGEEAHFVIVVGWVVCKRMIGIEEVIRVK